MDMRQAEKKQEQQNDHQYREYINKTVNFLQRTEDEEKQIRRQKGSLYAGELRKQMEEEKDRKNKMYNEMSEKERQLNMRGL